MNIIIDTPVIDKCWNLYDSYGEICVHCGCCSKDPLTRAKARIDVLTRIIGDNETFDQWDEDPYGRAVQERNIAANLKAFKRQLLYYRGRLEELEG